MTVSDTNHLQINRKLNLIALFACSIAYALILNTKWGKRWADEQTWATVAAGVGMTTLFVALEDKRAAHINWVYFYVAGIPMVARSLWLDLERKERAYRTQMKNGEQS